MDFEKEIFNFEHHEGCVRPFTLSLCEQVLVMMFKGLDQRDRVWKIFANEPDLDVASAFLFVLNFM
jgi:hypothetical protein